MCQPNLFSFQALNEVGQSSPSDSGVVTTPSTHPASVSNLHRATLSEVGEPEDHDVCTIEWDEPDDHGSPITSYRIRVDYVDTETMTCTDDDVIEDDDDIVTSDAENTYYSISGLMPDSKYK